MASEFFAEGGNKVAITLTPGEGGVLQVVAGGDKIFDKKEEDGKYPDLPRVKELRAIIKSKIN